MPEETTISKLISDEKITNESIVMDALKCYVRSLPLEERMKERSVIHDFIESTQYGYYTDVGEKGVKLSGGQRQRIGIARALYLDSQVLILDEATSAVDPETEVALVSALEQLSQGRTTISVAHRLSTAEKADLILVFDKGKIVEIGTHQELSIREGIYANLHNTWMGNTQSIG